MSPPDLFPPRDERHQRRRRALRRLSWVVLAVVVLLFVPLLWAWFELLGSRPQQDGEIAVNGLSRPVAVTWDAQGIPTILSDDRTDAALALGFLHGQERFFQMDLMRRQAAGELAALVGPALLEQDREMRVHRFRAVAQSILAQLPERAMAEAYARGVNAGLRALRTVPFEYRLLRAEPDPWLAEDIFLVVHAMYMELQGSRGAMEISLGVVHETLPEKMAQFLTAPGSEWEAPLEGTPARLPFLPDAEVFDLRSSAAPSPSTIDSRALPRPRSVLDRRVDVLTEQDANAGSNAWAVAGWRTTSGRALLAGDMHLGLAVPNIWYRASISFRDSTANQGRRRLSGFTLPGVPLMVVGTNGEVAWSFTAGNVDQSDIVILERAGGNAYRTPEGERELQTIVETIEVKGQDSETFTVRQSIWGPVIRTDARGRLLVQRWVAHDPTGINFGLLDVEAANDVPQAVQAMTRNAVPGLNAIVADASGSIAWTVAGRLPQRRGFDGRLPASWADGSRGWDGYVDPDAVPRVVDPEEGQVWSANHRHITGDGLRTLGESGYMVGGRATQIRDALTAMQSATPEDMLALQLDDRAVFLERWQELLLQTLSSQAARSEPALEEMRRLVANWGGRATIESVGYRLVRNYRFKVSDALLESILAPCLRQDESFRIWHFRERERPVWRILSTQPAHMLPRAYSTWEEFLVTMARETRNELETIGPLVERTWGERNTTRIQHPLSLAVPMLGRWLDMKPRPLPGDGNIPRMQSPTWGASQRMVVHVGDNATSLAHMPGGQSGHPLSPHYRKGHEDWEEGRPTPLEPGDTERTLQLLPSQ